MVKQFIEWLQWSCIYDPLVPKSKYINHVVVFLFLVYILDFLCIRSFFEWTVSFFLDKKTTTEKT